MNSRFLAVVICLNVVQFPSFSLNVLATQGNEVFASDFKEIRRLGQTKDSVGLENMAVELKARWKDVDMDRYCRLMHQLLARLRTDFDPIDYGKLKTFSEDMLSDLDRTLMQGIDPVLVPHYFGFQASYIGSTYGARYFYAFKGDTKDEAWVNQRTDVMTRLLKVWKLLQEAKDATWDINMSMPSMNVDPPDGGPSGISPDSVGDPKLRAQYVAEIQRVAEKHKWWGKQYELWKTERNLRKELLNDIKAMYNTPPLAPDELKTLLDTYVKDEEQKKMFLEASQVSPSSD